MKSDSAVLYNSFAFYSLDCINKPFGQITNLLKQMGLRIHEWHILDHLQKGPRIWSIVGIEASGDMKELNEKSILALVNIIRNHW